MKILHYITDVNASEPVAQQIQGMLAATARVAENYLFTACPPAGLPNQQTGEQEPQWLSKGEMRIAEVRYIKKPQGRAAVFSYMMLEHRMKTELRSIRPDVVHVHGAWDYMAAAAERAARHLGIVTIVSPHGALTPLTMTDEFLKKRLPRLLLYQQSMVRKCTAIMAMTQEEREQIVQTGLRAETRVETLLHSDTSGMDSLLPLYRKALDSTYYNYLTEAERQFAARAVRDSLLSAVPEGSALSASRQSDNQSTDSLPSLSKAVESYRRVYLYAWDEDVTDIMLRGAELNHVAMPPALDVAQLPRYRNKQAKQRGSLTDVAKTVNKTNLSATQQQELLAVTLIQRAYSLGMKHITLRHWAELYNLFRHADFDEDIVMAELKRLRLTSFTKKIQRILAREFLLPEGYNVV